MIGFLMSFGLGIITWTFMEYGFHHWYGHLTKGRNEFSREHLRHHADITYFSTNWKKALGAIGPLMALIALGTWASDIYLGVTYGMGVLSAYMFYEFTHYWDHVAPPRTRFGRWSRKHHFYHHFHDASVNHGVTAVVWDVLFRTNQPTGQIHVPRKWAMPWLVDAQTGEIHPEFRNDYVLTDKRIRTGDLNHGAVEVNLAG
jgi:hypothetical protein